MKKYLFGVAIIIAMFGCNADKKYDSENAAVSAVADTSAMADSAKIIKTADMRFRVKDVQKTKEKLTSTIKTLGGTIAEFSISSVIERSEKVKYSADSLKEITSYQQEGTVIAKVPSEKLDDFINLIAKEAVFVNSQGMKMDDRSISYLANRLKLANRAEAVKNINQSATKKGSNVETSMYIKDDYVDKKIENMQIDNSVRFSTITLNFYQDHTIKTLLVGNDNLSDYRPGFFQRLWLNIVDGWSYFTEFILALVNLWVFFAIGAIIYFVLRFFIRKRKLATTEATKNLTANMFDKK